MIPEPIGMVLIPAYNEGATIARIVAEAARITGWPVLVIDDGSQDDTVTQAATAGARVLPLLVNLGSWGAVQAGIRYALESGAGMVITMDADGQHLASCLPHLIVPIQAGETDVTIGAHVGRASPARLLAWRLFRSITGLGVEDLTSGFRGYNRAALQVLASPDATLLDYQDIGVLMLLREAGLRFLEVDVEMHPRSMGKSRVFSSWLRVARYLAVTLVLCVSKWERTWRPGQACDADPQAAARRHRSVAN
jgi:glycosyltransferase involved in cell wall biosynthesis